jgi:CrcB protein
VPALALHRFGGEGPAALPGMPRREAAGQRDLANGISCPSMSSPEPVDPDVDLHLPLDRSELVRHRVSILTAIAAGGALGALARHVVGEALPTAPGAFPWGTFLINVSGCLLIGILMAVLGLLPAPHRLARPFLGVGILGGFTTFSTYAVQSHELVRLGHPAVALAYLGGTVPAALLAVVGGVFLVRRVATARDLADRSSWSGQSGRSGRSSDGSVDGDRR